MKYITKIKILLNKKTHKPHVKMASLTANHTNNDHTTLSGQQAPGAAVRLPQLPLRGGGDASLRQGARRPHDIPRAMAQSGPESPDSGGAGYVTEKIMDCCISGCIPIYCGKLDNIDKNIFNIKRILFYESDNELSLNNCF